MASFSYQFHDCNGRVVPLESDGSAHSVDEARRHAILKAREVMAHEIHEGRLCLSCWIVVSDDRGFNSFTVHFGEAIRFTPHDQCVAAVE